MAGSFYRRGLVAGLAAAAGLSCWWLVAASELEHAAFCAVLADFAKPPFFLTGGGDGMWELRTILSDRRADAGKAPVMVSIGDDVGGVFQSSPPSPVDLAVVLQNLQRLGAKQAAIAAVMAWEKPDAGALKGLDMVLNHFQLVVQAAPLSRGTLRQAMPPAFRRAALTPDAIHGDLSRLPIINRVPVADVIFGQGQGTLAGFSSLDDDGDDVGNSLPLLARWEDENAVVLAFPLLTVLARCNLPVGGIQVKLGEFLRLGPAGPVVPIDRAGRMALPLKPLASRADIAAEDLIVGTPEIFPSAPGLIVLRDDQSRATHSTRKFSATLASAIAMIRSDAGLGPARGYRRLSGGWELALLMGAVLLLALSSAQPRFPRYLCCAILAISCLAAQWLGVGLAQVWLPGIPLLTATLVAAVMMHVLEEVPVRPLAALAGSSNPQWAVPRSIMIASPRFRPVTERKHPLPSRTSLIDTPTVKLPSLAETEAEPAPVAAPETVPEVVEASLWRDLIRSANETVPEVVEASIKPPLNPTGSQVESKKQAPAGKPRQAKRSAKKGGKRPPSKP